MRILHVCDSYLPRLGGIELHVDDLAARQRAGGDLVRVATLTPDDGAPGAGVVRLPRTRLLPGPGARAALSRLVAEADLVHAHASLVSPLVWAALQQADRQGVASVMTMHSMLPAGRAARVLRAVAPHVPTSTALTAVSVLAADGLRRLTGRGVAVLPNGIEPGEWRPTPRHVGRRPLTLVSTMRTTRRKRPLPLLDILREVRHTVPEHVDLAAVLVGAGPLDRAVRRELASSDLGGWVRQTGRLERTEILDVLSAADLYLAPARLESFGIAALEARCAGLPVIGMARSGLSDFIEDGVAGYLVDTDEQMARTASRLLVDPDELETMRSHNLRQPPPTDWTAVLALHREVYGSAVQASTAARALALA